ncbi:MAG: DUF6220 domain-containing protein [Actinobacteria bacterium]|nr:DUF6220 domain-containing protein [Actinomycetota bacterium]MCA1720812.1 DUF6220 domain-containing protein [Actinomycetota bacterium]
MRTTYKVLAYALAIEVLVQGMAIAYAIAGLGKWVEDDGGVLNKQLMDSDDPGFQGVGGFMVHGMNGMMLIPVLVLALLIVSLFAKIPGGTRRAGLLVGLVVLQVALGILSHSVPHLIMLHVLNAFGIFVAAGLAARSVGAATAAHGSVSIPAQATPQATATV